MSYLKRLVHLAPFAFLAVMVVPRGGDYDWHLPKGFYEPIVPEDNPMTGAKVDLGRHLFYDKRMSVNRKTSCATCHKQELAFTDGRDVAVGTTGQKHSRNTMSLVNVAYALPLTWSNPDLKRLEDQALVPMFGEHPVELGLKKGDRFLPTIRADKVYQRLFAAAFPEGGEPFSIDNVCKAIACFERTIISTRTPYDRYHYVRDDSAVSDSAKRGEELFFGQPFRCFHCHGGFNFSDATTSKLTPFRDPDFHNTGLYNVPGETSYPSPNVGIYEYTHNPKDIGKFKSPTLRNIAVTGPYMHDGSIKTLSEVLDHYAAGGRTIPSGPYAGIGHDNPNKDPNVGGFKLSPQRKADLIAFLECLTDKELLHDPKYADPWPAERQK